MDPRQSWRRLWPLHTTCEGWRLLRVKKPHVCHECGRTIKAGQTAWRTPAQFDRPGTYDPAAVQYLCAHGHAWRIGGFVAQEAD